MNNIGIVAVSDFCRNVANDEEIARLRADLDHRSQELAARAKKLNPTPKPVPGHPRALRGDLLTPPTQHQAQPPPAVLFLLCFLLSAGTVIIRP